VNIEWDNYNVIGTYVTKNGVVAANRYLPGKNDSFDDSRTMRSTLSYLNKSWIEIGSFENDFGSGFLASDYSFASLQGVMLLATANDQIEQLKVIPDEQRSIQFLFTVNLVWKGFGIGFPDRTEVINAVLGDNMSISGIDGILGWI
jgi:hypothetical protein